MDNTNPAGYERIDEKPKNKGISRGLRLGLSWPLAIIAFVALMSFFSLFGLYNISKQNVIAEALSSIDINKMQVGGLAEVFGSESVTEESTIAEAITALIAEQVELEISGEQVSGLLEDETFAGSVNDLYDDLLDAANSGNIDFDDLSDDIVSIFEDNVDLINEMAGTDISSQDISTLREELNSALGILNEAIDNNTDVNADNSTDAADVAPTEAMGETEKQEVAEGDDNVLIENGVLNVEGITATISSGVSAVSSLTGPSSQLNQVSSTYKELGKKVSVVRVYGLAVFGFLCLAGIIALNFRRLGTGFRFDAIVLMVVGALQALGALILGSIPKLIDFIVGKICEENPFLDPFRELINTIATKILSAASHSVMVAAIVCGVFGIVLLIASIVFSSLDKKKANA